MASEFTTETRRHGDAPRWLRPSPSLGVSVFVFVLMLLIVSPLVRAAPPSYAQVHALLSQRCLSCHDAKEEEGGFLVDTYEHLMKGGDDGVAVIPGHSDRSPIIAQLRHKAKPFMPPPKKAARLADAEIDLIAAWIDAGCPNGPAVIAAATRPSVPNIKPLIAPKPSIYSLAWSHSARLLAIGRHQSIDLINPTNRAVVRHLTGLADHVNALLFSSDGKFLFAASGEPSQQGQIAIFDLSSNAPAAFLLGHTDTIYCLALSPDGKMLASGSYDQTIILWDLAARKPIRTLTGHNGAVFCLSFRRDGNVLASASADRTIKLWDPRNGDRLDTFSEPLKEQNAVAFSPDGHRLAAGGADNRIRVYQISDKAIEGSNKLVDTKFAHEGSILRLAWSENGQSLLSCADDRTVKLWNTADMQQRLSLPEQSDWPSAIAFVESDKAVAVGRLDGALEVYDAATAKPIPAPKPQIASAWPRGIQVGHSTTIRITGANLANISSIRPANPKLTARVRSTNSGATEVVLELTAASDLPLNPIDLAVINAGGESNAIRLFPDTIPQLAVSTGSIPLNTSVWGKLDHPGQADSFSFEAKKGQTIVADLASPRLGFKIDGTLTLLDPAGHPIATSHHFDADNEPLIAHTIPADGRYTIRVGDLMSAASPEHIYRLSVGTFQYATGTYPLAISANQASTVRLLGFNIPETADIELSPKAAGQVPVPVPACIRTRKALSVLVTLTPELISLAKVAIPVPGSVNGRLITPGASETFSFHAEKGQPLVLETLASRRGSPTDTRIEILDSSDRPVQRLVLRAMRDSYITFRGFDANAGGGRLQNWEEMQLDQYLYMNGEVVRLFLAPRGPDSEFNFYTSAGRRRCYFDTSATAHALDEPCYIVEPLPPGTPIPNNGLPAFPLYYANDDDGLRELGTDSRIAFDPPATGDYRVRVTDTRGFGGERYTYRLTIRPARPDFRVSLEANGSIPAGSGRTFTVRAHRIDGFEGPITVNLSNIPAGFAISSPLVIQAGHSEAQGTVYALPGAKAPARSELGLAASAVVDGKTVTKQVGAFPAISIAGRPQVEVWLEPWRESAGPATLPSSTPLDITIGRGQLVPARLHIRRNGYKGLVSFDVLDLPHGVIVADIGLNGVLIPETQTEQRIFLHCDSWVPVTDRPCHAQAREVGNPTSRPLMLHVR